MSFVSFGGVQLTSHDVWIMIMIRRCGRNGGAVGSRIQRYQGTDGERGNWKIEGREIELTATCTVQDGTRAQDDNFVVPVHVEISVSAVHVTYLDCLYAYDSVGDAAWCSARTPRISARN